MTAPTPDNSPRVPDAGKATVIGKLLRACQQALPLLQIMAVRDSDPGLQNKAELAADAVSAAISAADPFVDKSEGSPVFGGATREQMEEWIRQQRAKEQNQ